MQTLEILEGIKAQSIADNITMLLQSQNILTVQAVGSDAINETTSGIAKAKKTLHSSFIHLNSKLVLPKLISQDKQTTCMGFQLTTEPLFIEIDSLT